MCISGGRNKVHKLKFILIKNGNVDYDVYSERKWLKMDKKKLGWCIIFLGIAVSAYILLLR